MAGSATLTTVASSTTRPEPSTVTNRTHRPAGERCRTHMAASSLPKRVTDCVVLRNSHGIRVAARRAGLTRQGGEMAMATRSRGKGARARTGVLAIVAVSVLLLGEPRGAMAREALGDHWAKRSAEEQNEFARLFVNLFEDAYLSKIRLAEADKFEYLGETAVGNEVVVRTRVVTRNGSAIPVNYLTRRDEAGRWRVYDLDVERISLVRNYRSQFASIIRRTSFEQLLARLKAVEDKRNSFEG